MHYIFRSRNTGGQTAACASDRQKTNEWILFLPRVQIMSRDTDYT